MSQSCIKSNGKTNLEVKVVNRMWVVLNEELVNNNDAGQKLLSNQVRLFKDPSPFTHIPDNGLILLLNAAL